MTSIIDPRERARADYEREAERATDPHGDGLALLRPLAAFPPEPVEWLWPGRIPLRAMTLVYGDGGEGKSMLSIDLAARVSAGIAFPDLFADGADPGGVVLLSGEDDPRTTIRPRLDAAGGDPERVMLLEGLRGPDGKPRGITLGDVDALEEAIQRTPDCRVLIVDPVGCYYGVVDAHRESEVRAVLAPLAETARRRGVSIVLIAHRNKGGAGRSMYRVSGSVGLPNAVRMSWHVGRATDDPSRRLLLPAKANIVAEPTGLAFTIGGDPPRVRWESGAIRMTADDLARAESDAAGDDGGALAEAVGFLESELGSRSRPAREMTEAAEDAGIRDRTLARAKKKLGVQSIRDGASGRWFWTLPQGDQGGKAAKGANA